MNVTHAWQLFSKYIFFLPFGIFASNVAYRQKNKCTIGIHGQSQCKSHRDRGAWMYVLSADEVWYSFRCLKRNFASVLENTYAFKIASVGLTEASAPVWRHCICKTWRPLLVAILMMTSMNSKMVSKLHPKNKPMLPPISPKNIQEAEL